MSFFELLQFYVVWVPISIIWFCLTVGWGCGVFSCFRRK